jgi:hypothetical protein
VNVWMVYDAQLAVLDALDPRIYADERARIAGTWTRSRGLETPPQRTRLDPSASPIEDDHDLLAGSSTFVWRRRYADAAGERDTGEANIEPHTLTPSVHQAVGMCRNGSSGTSAWPSDHALH